MCLKLEKCLAGTNIESWNPKGRGSWSKGFRGSAILISKVRGTRGSLLEGTSQPDDPGGVGGLVGWDLCDSRWIKQCLASNMSNALDVFFDVVPWCLEL